MTMDDSYIRPLGEVISARLREPRRFIQIIAGPRQVGKTTLVRQVLRICAVPSIYASADEPTLGGTLWIQQQWEAARLLARNQLEGSVLALDEIQKIPGWSETVKRLWDEDGAHGVSLKVILLGSAPLLIQRGLTESLAGRFETIPMWHWSFTEMKAAFGWSADQYMFFGGYPGSAPLADDEDRWRRYVRDALIETTISRDVLLLTRVDKPALLRRLFELACAYSCQVLSYQKMIGQLQDAGNTTTLAHYLDLLGASGMVRGIRKFAGQWVRQRAASPKLLVLNTALMSAQVGLNFDQARSDPEWWGRLVESAVGAHLASAVAAGTCELFYWRDRNREVDFIAAAQEKLVAIEVKSGRHRFELPGTSAFAGAFHPTRTLLVGTGGIPIEEFLAQPVEHWIS